MSKGMGPHIPLASLAAMSGGKRSRTEDAEGYHPTCTSGVRKVGDTASGAERTEGILDGVGGKTPRLSPLQRGRKEEQSGALTERLPASGTWRERSCHLR